MLVRMLIFVGLFFSGCVIAQSESGTVALKKNKKWSMKKMVSPAKRNNLAAFCFKKKPLYPKIQPGTLTVAAFVDTTLAISSPSFLHPLPTSPQRCVPYQLPPTSQVQQRKFLSLKSNIFAIKRFMHVQNDNKQIHYALQGGPYFNRLTNTLLNDYTRALTPLFDKNNTSESQTQGLSLDLRTPLQNFTQNLFANGNNQYVKFRENINIQTIDDNERTRLIVNNIIDERIRTQTLLNNRNTLFMFRINYKLW